ncbi:MAG: DegV family protein [Halanaerobium sp.]|nr:DegV family protein [Halanaerobium sp.]
MEVLAIKIITDSCCDLTDELLNGVEVVPMTVIIDGKDYKDGDDISREEFYQRLSTAENPPGSASPSPKDFFDKFSQAEKIFIVTVSSALSSSYEHALLAGENYTRQFKDKLVYVFDSLNASVGQGLTVLKLKRMVEDNLSPAKILNNLEEYIKGLKTFFLLENMDNLINSGRMNRLLGKVVSVLNIKFIMGKNSEGRIELYDKVRGSKRAFNKLLETIGEYGSDFEDRVLGIAHCNALEKAERFKEEVERMYNFKEIVITKMGPTIATYADIGGLLISF